MIGRRAGRPGRFNSAFSSGPGSTSKTMFVSSDFALPSARSIPTSGCSPLRPRAPPAFTAPPAPPPLPLSSAAAARATSAASASRAAAAASASLSSPPPPPSPSPSRPPPSRPPRRSSSSSSSRSSAIARHALAPPRNSKKSTASSGARAKASTVTRRVSGGKSSHRRSSRAACCAPVTTPRGPEAAPRTSCATTALSTNASRWCGESVRYWCARATGEAPCSTRRRYSAMKATGSSGRFSRTSATASFRYTVRLLASKAATSRGSGAAGERAAPEEGLGGGRRRPNETSAIDPAGATRSRRGLQTRAPLQVI